LGVRHIAVTPKFLKRFALRVDMTLHVSRDGLEARVTV
jgi:hypothetical protein